MKDDADEITFAGLWQILVRYRVLIFGFPTIFILVAILRFFWAAPQWEGSMIVQIGQVDEARFIEPRERVKERLKTRSFQDLVLKNGGLSPEKNGDVAALFSRSLHIKALDDPALISVRLRAGSQSAASQLTLSTFEVLRQAHEQMLGSHAAPLQAELDRLNARIASFPAAAGTSKEPIDSQRQRSLTDLFHVYVSIERSNELRALGQEKLLLQRQLNPLFTFPTRLLEQPHVGTRPVSPNLWLESVLAALAGLFLAFFLAFILSLRNR